MSDRPIILGPDALGRTLVVAGDRVCWSGAGVPPKMPGALELRCPEAVIGAGGTAWVEEELDAIDDLAELRLRAARTAERLLAAGGTSAIVLIRPRVEVDECLDAAASGLRRAGLRALLACVADDRSFDAAHARRCGEESRRYILANRQSLMRGAAAVAPGASAEVRAAAADVADGTGCLVIGAGGPAAGGVPADLLGRGFGRRAGVLEEGALGDAVAMKDGAAALVIVAGRIVLRDGRPVGP